MGAFSSTLALRGRPGLRFVELGVSAFSGASVAVTATSFSVTGALGASVTGAFTASATGCTLAAATEASAFALVRSPFLLAVKTLSVLSFLRLRGYVSVVCPLYALLSAFQQQPFW